MDKNDEQLNIAGEVFLRRSIPNVAGWYDHDPNLTEARIKDLANRWHEGSIVAAVQALESDMAHA